MWRWMATIIVVMASQQLLAQAGKPDQLLLVGSPNRGLDPNAVLAPLWEKALPEAGWAKHSVVEWKDLTPALLRQTRLVVLAVPPARPEVTAEDEAIVDLLVDYVKAGGGLMLCQIAAQNTFQELLLTDTLARRFGTRILVEQFGADPKQTSTTPQGDAISFTSQVYGPVTNGVRGICFPGNFSFMVVHNVMPFLPDAPWQVVLAAGPGTRTIPTRLGLDDFDRDVRATGFERDVPLAGIREYGQGRVAYAGLYVPHIFGRGSGTDRAAFETYMTRGGGGHPSDLLTFYLNTFRWLSANADQLANATLTKRDAPPDGRTTEWKEFKGVVGARTTYSTGTSTPDEYVAKARAMGLDYIIFLEDMAALHPTGFKNLKADCKRLSDGKFLAIPGITYVNTDGNHQYVYGPFLRLPSEMLTDNTGKRTLVRFANGTGYMTYVEMHWLYQLLGFENNGGWFNFSRNPYPSYDVRDYANMGVVAQEDGKTLDFELGGYGLNNRNGQSLLPQAITLLKNAREMEACTNGTYFLNVIGAEGTKQLYSFLTGGAAGRIGSHLYPGAPPFGQTYVTTGPEIELIMPRADTDAGGDLYNKNLQEWPLNLKAASPAGLKEVLLMDGDRMIRRFLPDGASNFAFATSIAKERQKYLWVHAKDRRGGQAISRAINCNSWILRENQCTDRNNQLLDSRQLRPDGSPFFVGFCGDTAIPDKGPWNGRLRPIGCFQFDKKLGAPPGVYDGSPENNPSCSWAPSVAYAGQEPARVGLRRHLVAGHEGVPHVKPYRVVASSEVLVGDRVLDGVFPLTDTPVFYVHHDVYPVTPSTFLTTTGRTTFYLIKPDGISAYLWEQDVVFLKDVPVATNDPAFLCLGSFDYAGTATETLYAHKGKAIERAPAPGGAVRLRAFDNGDYMGFIKSPFGSLTVYSLTDGLVLKGDNTTVSVYAKAGGAVVKAGTRYRARLLAVGMHRNVADPEALAAAIRDQYGLGVPATGYTVQADHGTVADQAYTLKLAAGADGCFRGTIKGLKSMAGNLGCQVTGLNDRWTAVFQQQGKPPKLRLIPVEEGIGYAVLRDDDDGTPLFIGHPFTADNSTVVLQLALSKDGKQWQLEIHNPTDRTVKAKVRSVPGLMGFSFSEKLKLPPGSSLFRVIDAGIGLTK